MKINIDSNTTLQSPDLYLQVAGSTAADGSTAGHHLRWDLINELQDVIPKGYIQNILDEVDVNDNVQIFRAPYDEKFETVINFGINKPSTYNTIDRSWTFTFENSSKSVYLYFRDLTSFDQALAKVNPTIDPVAFIKEYGSGIIEAKVMGELFFNAAVTLVHDGDNPTLNAEMLSRVDDDSDSFQVTCRQSFNGGDFVPVPLTTTLGENILRCGVHGHSGAFSSGAFNTGTFSTGSFYTGHSCSTGDLESRTDWHVDVKQNTTYCFTGFIMSNYTAGASQVKIDIYGDAGETTSCTIDLLNDSNWEEMLCEWDSGDSVEANIKITSLVQNVGFSLDDLYFGEKIIQNGLRGNLRSENVKSIRFQVNASKSYLQEIRFETYADFIAGKDAKDAWTELGVTYTDSTTGNPVTKTGFGLTQNTDEAYARLRSDIHGNWPKYNETAKVNLAAYQTRWSNSVTFNDPENTGQTITQDVGVKGAVDAYIEEIRKDKETLAAIAKLPSWISNAVNKVINKDNISMLSAIKFSALDYHVARMVGLGHIDSTTASSNHQYIYVAKYNANIYKSFLSLNRNKHVFCSIPTSKFESRLPVAPEIDRFEYGAQSDPEGGHTPLTDENGYTQDCTARFIQVYAKDDAPNNGINESFFASSMEFCAIHFTHSVSFGLEYREQGGDKLYPELLHTTEYTDSNGKYETRTTLNQDDNNLPIFVHAEENEGIHEYAAYGVNWFSRASTPGNFTATDETKFPPKNTILPPSDFFAQAIQVERPLLLTSQDDQDKLASITGTDKALARVTFNYNHIQDSMFNPEKGGNHHFADKVQLFFKENMPVTIAGTIKAIKKINDRVFEVTTNKRDTNTWNSAYATTFVGGEITIRGDVFIIQSAHAPTAKNGGVKFKVKSKPLNTATEDPNYSAPEADNTTRSKYKNNTSWQIPSLENIANTYFTARENIYESAAWGSNPLPKEIKLFPEDAPGANPVVWGNVWSEEDEVIVNPNIVSEDPNEGKTTTRLRGIWEPASISDIKDSDDNIIGVYKIIFTNFNLPDYPNPVGEEGDISWHRGTVRVPLSNDSSEIYQKRALQVTKIQNVGNNLELVAVDVNYENEPVKIKTGNVNQVNFYPGYRVYVKADATSDFIWDNIKPENGELDKSTIMSSRTYNETLVDQSIIEPEEQFFSQLSSHAVLKTREIIEPQQPQIVPPSEKVFASRPDFFNRANFSFPIPKSSGHTPFALVAYRANDLAILKALYKDDTIDAIRASLKMDTETVKIKSFMDDTYLNNRWVDLVTANIVVSPNTADDNLFPLYTGDDLEYGFPAPDKGQPDNQTIINTHGTDRETLRSVILKMLEKAFTPLTKQPMLYSEINSARPEPGPQTALNQAPMAQKKSNGDVLFTDFTLDGAANHIYFYTTREMGSLMKLGDFSAIYGPVQLINSSAAQPPKVSKLTVQEADEAQNLNSEIQLQVMPYAEEQHIEKIRLYRANKAEDAASIRTMQLAKEIDYATVADRVLINDDFSQDPFLPYGDPLFYKVVALRKIEVPVTPVPGTDKSDGGAFELAPSKPSKTMITTLVDPHNPVAPVITTEGGISDDDYINGMVLKWNSTVHNGTYYLQKQTASGNWVEVYNIKSNDAVMQYPPLEEDGSVVFDGTILKDLPRKDEDGKHIYHRFRVRVESSAGKFNLTEEPKTIHLGAEELETLTNVVSLTDTSHTVSVLRSMSIDEGNRSPVFLEFTDIHTTPTGHVFQKMAITVTDDLGNTSTKETTTKDGTIRFDHGDGNLVLDDSNPNRTYTINIAIHTDKFPSGADITYTVSYISTPETAFREMDGYMTNLDGNGQSLTLDGDETLLYPAPLSFLITDNLDLNSIPGLTTTVLNTSNEAAWDSSTIYGVAGLKVQHNGKEYQSKWWTQNDEPGTQQYGPWEIINSFGIWDITLSYNVDDEVIHEGQHYKAKLWSSGTVPSNDPNGPWEPIAGPSFESDVFEYMDVTVTDSSNNSVTNRIDTKGGNVSFANGEGGLMLNDASNKVFTIEVATKLNFTTTPVVKSYILSYT